MMTYAQKMELVNQARSHEHTEFWARAMSRPVEVPPEESPEPQLPPSVRERSQWGQDVPTIDSLRSHGQFADGPEVEPATSDRPIDSSTIVGSATPQARKNHSSWRPFDGPWDD
jgi:hypothetical protein